MATPEPKSIKLDALLSAVESVSAVESGLLKEFFNGKEDSLGEQSPEEWGVAVLEYLLSKRRPIAESRKISIAVEQRLQGMYKLSIAIATLGNLKWRPGMNFCRGTGSKWTFQESVALNETLKKGLKEQLTASENNLDKSARPIFMICSGAGTGKSRLLDEFHDLAKKVTGDDSKLNKKIMGSYVFKVDLENGTFEFPAHYVSSRMLHQIVHPAIPWGDFKEKYAPPSIPYLFEVIARAENKAIEETSFIILVDGLQKLDHQSGSKTSVLYQVLSCLADESNASWWPGHPFVIVCVATTVNEPIHTWLSGTRQLIYSLLPVKLDGAAIIEPCDIVEEVMVMDMGGHGCSLELLQKELPKYRQGEGSCLSVMDTICFSLKAFYPNWIDIGDILLTVQSILGGRKFTSLQEKLGNRTIDEYQQLGLIRWNQLSGCLECPLVWLRVVSEKYPEMAILLDAESRYKTASHLDNPTGFPIDKLWQHWEEFVANFFCLKTRIFANQKVHWAELHSGALLSNCSDIIDVKPLTLIKAKHHHPTSSARASQVLTIDNEIIDPRDCNHHILSAHGGDSFCFLKLPDRKVAYAISCKNNMARKRTVAEYCEEFEKAASEGDFFMEFSTGKYLSFDASSFPSSRCGLVCQSGYERYFGPFAGRAHFLLKGVPNINTAPKKHLRLVDGIGETLADNIITERRKRRFRSEEDALCRLRGIGKKKIKIFTF